jgi:hypothetical protein
MQIVLHYIYNFHTQNVGVTRIVFGHSGVIDTAVTKVGNFLVDLVEEKTRGRKPRARVPLTNFISVPERDLLGQAKNLNHNLVK